MKEIEKRNRRERKKKWNVNVRSGFEEMARGKTAKCQKALKEIIVKRKLGFE